LAAVKARLELNVDADLSDLIGPAAEGARVEKSHRGDALDKFE
jgi:hypothetical protein